MSKRYLTITASTTAHRCNLDKAVKAWGGSGYQRGFPRYKKRGDKLKSLQNLNAGCKSNVAIGDLRAKVKAKAGVRGREFQLTPAPYSSQTCNTCGAVDKKNRKDEKFVCRSCGNTDHADVNAAKNHLKVGREMFLGTYRAWSREVMPGQGESPFPDRTSRSGKGRKASANLPCATGSCSQQHDLVLTGSNLEHRKPQPRKPRKRRSAQSAAETFVQLDFWDTALAIGL